MSEVGQCGHGAQCKIIVALRASRPIHVCVFCTAGRGHPRGGVGAQAAARLASDWLAMLECLLRSSSFRGGPIGIRRPAMPRPRLSCDTCNLNQTDGHTYTTNTYHTTRSKPFLILRHVRAICLRRYRPTCRNRCVACHLCFAHALFRHDLYTSTRTLFLSSCHRLRGSNGGAALNHARRTSAGPRGRRTRSLPEVPGHQPSRCCIDRRAT